MRLKWENVLDDKDSNDFRAYYGKLEEWSLRRTNAVGMDSVAKLSGIKRD